MSQDLMNYEQMRSLALRGVVRDAIRRVIREDGLPGAHHFYITFLTRYPGVEIDDALADKYKEEITIVLEHQFWDLAANSDDFEVTLKFGGIPKYLRVPYHAITRFHDPSVGFSLAFETPAEMEGGPVLDLTPSTSLGAPAPTGLGIPDKAADTALVPATEETDPEDTPTDDGPKVVSLDSFRKK
ncbi:ClpXP protease specificity-enhancing factor SspB [uncultured Algimonas sp.]|uniref:SspB family protein n=1 Tax=uncultured Algimonas sp. TaxID=1547920 RepID=UPI0026173480|nr:ClpXP protease specificity-enhancing factor SspB [uncultured Algimonas sp.]